MHSEKYVVLFSLAPTIYVTAFMELGHLWPRDNAPSTHKYSAPGANDQRSPCPMVNSLANHGYLPRDGRNINFNDLFVAFNQAVNLDDDTGRDQWTSELAHLKTTTGTSDSLNLADLNQPDVIEHDGSFTRSDLAVRDNHSFNQTVWNSVASHFTDNTIDIETFARARLERLAEAKAENPQFHLTPEGDWISKTEVALTLMVFTNGTQGFANTDWVKTFIEKETLPYDQGWTPPKTPITLDAVQAMTKLVDQYR